MGFDQITDSIVGLLLKVHGTESFLHRYQGYRSNSCLTWRRKNNLSWRLSWKILQGIRIFDNQQVRKTIGDLVKQNPAVFSGTYYIAAFGKVGKSGDVIMYEFKHSVKVKEELLVKVSDLPSLPPDSKIIFVEDLIGTGTQSIDYITERLNLLLNPSHIPYLLAVCATPEAVKRIHDNSNFTVLTGITLDQKDYQHYTSEAEYFSTAEKKILTELNGQLKDEKKFDYDRGLLLSFSFAIPNNSMPILWKDGYHYKDSQGKDKEWYALLPRYF